MKLRSCVLAGIVSALSAGVAGASPTRGQTDTFQDGTTDNWITGRSSSPRNVNTGGPAGAGDAFIEMLSTGIGGPGSKAIIFNRTQWAGNYNSAGITEIDMDLKNLGNTPLRMRLAFDQSSGGPGYVTTNAFALPTDGAWHHATFRINSTDLTPLEGPPALNTLLSNVGEVRILSATSPSLDGDNIAATIGVDNVKAVPEPVSGLVALAGALLLPRRRCTRSTPQ
jgi:hypothetical protein